MGEGNVEAVVFEVYVLRFALGEWGGSVVNNHVGPAFSGTRHFTCLFEGRMARYCVFSFYVQAISMSWKLCAHDADCTKAERVNVLILEYPVINTSQLVIVFN